MKTTSVFKQILLALTIMASMAACTKDKKIDPFSLPVVKTISLKDLKALSTGAAMKVHENTKISGIVISDAGSMNIDNKTVILQDTSAQTGIIVTFDAMQSFAAGDHVEVNISGQTLAQVNSEILLQNVPAANAKKIGVGTIKAKAATLEDIITNKVAWDGTLVSITSADLILTGGSGKYSGILTIANATGSLTSNILVGAGFENTVYPVSVSAITGIVRTSGTDIRVDIRKTADIVIGSVTRLVTENFTNITPIAPIDLRFNPANIAEAGGFTTAAGSWALLSQFFWLFPGTKFDSDFTTPGRSYVYSITQELSGSSGMGGGSMGCNSTNLAGLKTVSVTFAGSKMSGTNLFHDFSAYGDSMHAAGDRYYSVPPFDGSKNYFQIEIIPAGIYNQELYTSKGLIDAFTPAALSVIKVSDKYTQAGQFHTVTWTLPTKEQLLAMGVSSADANAWAANPIFNICNLSPEANYSSVINADGSTTSSGIWNPILFDTVVLGF